jgi:hypothetical protein
MKDEIIENIKTAAQQGEIKTISKWTRAAEKCESFIEELTTLNSRIVEFKNFFWPETNEGIIASNKNSNIDDNNIAKSKLSPKQQGAKIRSSWVQNLTSKGIFLNGHGKSYSTEHGKSVGIASANELNRPQLVSKWFLGLKDEPADVVVLLCRDLEGKLFDIVIPVVSMEELWKYLSRSKDQIKFHVQRRNGEFFLSVPRKDPLTVSKFISNYKPLMS